MLKRFCLLTVFLVSQFIQSQACWHSEYEQLLEKHYPGISELADRTFEKAKTSPLEKTPSEVLRIPVVVHIVYNSSIFNLNDLQIERQIEVLNKDFQRLNDDAWKTRDVFSDVIGNPNIEFYLAKIDPNGLATNGIVRTHASKTSPYSDIVIDSFEDYENLGFEQIYDGLTSLKYTDQGGSDAWDTKRYYNIWIGNLSINIFGQSSPIIAGIGFPPIDAPNWEDADFPSNLNEVDGVVLHYQVVGLEYQSASLNGWLGSKRTLTHETGHYLGLRHIWGDGDCEEDDGLLDTPTAGSSSNPTTQFTPCEEAWEKDTCLEDSLPDMIENYMVISNETLIAYDDWKLYPSPASESITLKGINFNSTVRIFDLEGSLLSNQQYNGEKIDLSNFANGVYFLELNFNGEQRLKKFLIQR